MGLDFPDFGAALWEMSDATGIRPEYAIITMMLESRLNPAAMNPGSGCVGLNQMCGGVPASYSAWPASQQVRQVIKPFWASLIAKYGSIGSGTRLQQVNLLPASYDWAKLPWQTVVSQSKDIAGAYAGNSGVFDPKGKKKITVQMIADALTALVTSKQVQYAIEQTYALRDYEVPLDPVYGSDFAYEGKLSSLVGLIYDTAGRAVSYVSGGRIEFS